MSGLRAYILSVVAAAVIAAIVKELAGRGSLGKLVKYLAGLFMAITLLSPLVKLELPDVEGWLSDFRTAGTDAAAAGMDMANEASRELIKARVESYILDKAAAYGTNLAVDVELDATGLPVGVTLRGAVSPAVKARMARFISLELGMGEEVQRWIE